LKLKPHSDLKMNIFYINPDPIVAAQELCDDHIRKMQIESAQLCSAAHWLTGSSAPYKKTHINHPSAIWTRESIQHYNWVVRHGLEICNEFTKRYGKYHKTQGVLEWLRDNKPNLPDNGFTDPPMCMPNDVKCSDTTEAYKNYYRVYKTFAKWIKLDNQPVWMAR
jgi:hypothetical protein